MQNVRIVCISDTHCEHNNIRGGIPACDILVHAGDITYEGRYEKLQKFDDWGRGLPLPPERRICIAGNHEITLDGDLDTAKVLLSSWTYLQDEAYEVCGLKFWGTPWSRAFGEGWGFQLRSPEAAQACWDMIPEDTDVLIVHGPPHGYGDKLEQGEHVGCPKLTERLMDIKPTLTICGHVHSDPGIFAAPWGTVVNASIMSEGYRPKQKPQVVNVRV